MLILKRGEIETRILRDQLEEVETLSSLSKNGTLELDIRDITLGLIEENLKDVNITIYFKQWNDLCLQLVNSLNAKVDNSLEDVEYEGIQILAKLKELNNEQKLSLAIKLAKGEEDFILIDDAFNKGVINPDNALRRLITNE